MTRYIRLKLATVIALVLLVPANGQAQVAPVPPFPVRETVMEGDKKGEWELKTEVKNDTSETADIVWWTWPAEKGGKKIGDLKWYPEGTVSEDPVPGEDDGQKERRKKRPKTSDANTNPGATVPAGEKRTGTVTKSKKPYTVYVRVFKKNADGTWRGPGPGGLNFGVNTIRHDSFLAAFRIHETDPPSEYISLPVRIPYPTDLADLTGGRSASFFIKSVTLSKGFSLAFLAPNIGRRFILKSNQREFSGTFVARMSNELAEGEQAVLGVTWGAESEEITEKITRYETIIRYLLVKDNSPPSIALRAEPTPEGTLVTIGVKDPGGIHHLPHLAASIVVGPSISTQVFVVPLARVLQEDPQQEIGATSAEFEIMVRSPGAGEILNLEASATDQFGNASSSRTEVTP